MRMKIFAALFVLMYALVVASTFYASTRNFKTEPETKVLEAEKISCYGINIYRDQEHLPPFKENNDLFLSAAHRASDIDTGKKPFSHEGYEVILQRYYGYSPVIGENLAIDHGNEWEALEGWQRSASHSAVLLSKKACECGFAKFNKTYVLHIGCR